MVKQGRKPRSLKDTSKHPLHSSCAKKDGVHLQRVAGKGDYKGETKSKYDRGRKPKYDRRKAEKTKKNKEMVCATWKNEEATDLARDI